MAELKWVPPLLAHNTYFGPQFQKKRREFSLSPKNDIPGFVNHIKDMLIINGP